MIPLTKEQRQELKVRAPKDPLWWIHKVLDVELWDLQKQVIESVRDNPRTSVRSCHGIGKSFIAGNAALWFLYNHPFSIVITTAPTWRQVEKLIWKEIRSSVRKSKLYLGGELAKKSPELQIVQDEWVALGLSTNQPDRFQGFHARHIFVIVDEGSGVKEDIYEAIEEVLTSAHCRLLLLGNPTLIGGTFYRSHRDPGWKTFHVSAWSSPNFTEFTITEADLESGAWADKAPKNPDGSFSWPLSLPHHTRMGGRPAEAVGEGAPGLSGQGGRQLPDARRKYRYPLSVDRSRHGTLARH